MPELPDNLRRLSGMVHQRLYQPVAFGRHWRREARVDPDPDGLRVVVLGDSTAVGIGARRPHQGFVGRTADYLRERTGRPIHITNLAAGGARTRDVVRKQLDKADFTGSDLVLVSVGPNDAMRNDPVERFEREAATLLDLLPTACTVFSDVAAVPGHEPYQDVLARLADERGIRRARFLPVFLAAGRGDIFADDGLHLNSVGYEIWFHAFRPQVDAVLRLDPDLSVAGA